MKAQWFLRRPEDEGQPKDDNFVLWTIQYTLRDRPAIDNYIAHHGWFFVTTMHNTVQLLR